MTGWISVKDKLPENGAHLLVSDGKMVISAMRIKDDWLIPPFMNEVTHWMELPEPPQ